MRSCFRSCSSTARAEGWPSATLASPTAALSSPLAWWSSARKASSAARASRSSSAPLWSLPAGAALASQSSSRANRSSSRSSWDRSCLSSQSWSRSRGRDPSKGVQACNSPCVRSSASCTSAREADISRNRSSYSSRPACASRSSAVDAAPSCRCSSSLPSRVQRPSSHSPGSACGHPPASVTERDSASRRRTVASRSPTVSAWSPSSGPVPSARPRLASKRASEASRASGRASLTPGSGVGPSSSTSCSPRGPWVRPARGAPSRAPSARPRISARPLSQRSSARAAESRSSARARAAR
mmetsp:Transcript_66477/g.195001  ORF Transcript_66477/g.195001 Transcript_66477/m.195001 type:complete len:299 (-) Transcript_66477:676-1572(-)